MKKTDLNARVNDARSYITAKTVLAVALENISTTRLNAYNHEDVQNRKNLQYRSQVRSK